MKKYNFLFKPLFFICSLLFATWMVLEIERVSPSDFGKYRYLFESKEDTDKRVIEEKAKARDFLRNLCVRYKRGAVDSLTLEKTLEGYLGIKRTEDKQN